jgi:hypothetical protein
MVTLLHVAFRIKSGTDVNRRYTPVFDALEHLLDPSFRESIGFIRGNPGPYILEISTNEWITWKDVGVLSDFTERHSLLYSGTSTT